MGVGEKCQGCLRLHPNQRVELGQGLEQGLELEQGPVGGRHRERLHPVQEEPSRSWRRSWSGGRSWMSWRGWRSRCKQNKQSVGSWSRSQHVDPGNCNICHKYFASKVKLNIHIQKNHTYGPEKQPRTYLGKVSRARSNLSQHMKSHNNIVIEKLNPVPKSFPCNNCKKLFKRNLIN